MTEIIEDKVSIDILHVEILIALGYYMILRYMSNGVKTFC